MENITIEHSKSLMEENSADQIRSRLEAVYRTESRRVLATLIRLLGDFDLAEEALHDAFKAALEQWPRDGEPANPRAWLISAGRFKAIDRIRRRARFEPLDDSASGPVIASVEDFSEKAGESVQDDLLRLIFICCHPALSPDARVALTLREVCGFTTEEIAHAFLIPLPTLAQRIVRAKAKMRDARIPYQVPALAELPDRLEAVLRVVYLVFNEGYAASSGERLTRPDLSAVAVRLGRQLAGLLPEPETIGLLMRIDPSPVVALNRAVAVAMRDGPETGLAIIDDILSRGDLADYHLGHAARADLCRKSGNIEQARAAYERALSLTHQAPERRFLERRLRELPAWNTFFFCPLSNPRFAKRLSSDTNG